MRPKQTKLPNSHRLRHVLQRHHKKPNSSITNHNVINFMRLIEQWRKHPISVSWVSPVLLGVIKLPRYGTNHRHDVKHRHGTEPHRKSVQKDPDRVTAGPPHGQTRVVFASWSEHVTTARDEPHLTDSNSVPPSVGDTKNSLFVYSL